MSMPTIPNLTPEIDLKPGDVALTLLMSIALEEIGLAHIINAEGEKIQAVLGTLNYDPAGGYSAPSLEALLAINESVRETLETVITKEAFLNFKFEKVLKFLAAYPAAGYPAAPPPPPSP